MATEAETTNPDGSALARELARARERLAFYEGFDRLIQENIARSGDLLRQAAEQREAALREAEQTRAELDRRRGEQRETMTRLAEDLLGLQRQVGELTGRVMGAIDDLASSASGASIPITLADAAPPPTPPPETPAVGASPSPMPSAPRSPHADPAASGAGGSDAFASAAPAPRPSAPPAAATGPRTAAPPPTGNAPIGIPSPTAAEPSAGPPGSPADAPPTPPAPDAETGAAVGAVAATSSAEAPLAVAVVVHGMPRAAAALALQRHLAGLPQVEAVEAREYVANVLRLQVQTRSPLTLADLRGWTDGADLEPVNVLPDVVEVRLPTAER